MNRLTDQQLLRDYSERRSEPAFAELVHRHVDLIYSAALRMVCDAHLAKDVTQGAFIALAKSAPQLIDRPVLSGWLYHTAQNLAANVVRSEVRRRNREKEAVVMNELLSAGSETSWEAISPHLDAALRELSEADRDALMLRYFEKKSAVEMASILGISDEAAQKRVSRAVERVREFFSKRNVTIGASGLVALISANAVQSAPVGMAAAISAAAVAGTAVTTSTIVSATKAIAMTTLQKAIITTALVATVGAAAYEARRASTWQAQAQQLIAQPPASAVSSNDDELATLHGRLILLTRQNAELSSAFDKANTENAQLKKQLEQARHTTALFRDLANQAHSADGSTTNDFSSPRDVLVAMGQKFRQYTQLKSQDTSKLSDDDQKANGTAVINLGLDMVNLIKVLTQFDQNTQDDNHRTADLASCLLYGALDLNNQQFNQVYGLLQKFHDQAVQQNLLKDDAPPEAATALKQLDEQAISEIQNLLTPDQAAIFEQLVPNLKLGGKDFNFNFNFNDDQNSGTAAK